MRTRATRRDSFFRRVPILLLLCHAGFAACQPLPAPFADDRPPRLVMVGRDDPADPSRYMRVYGDDLTDAVAIYRDGRRLRTTVPQTLRRGDEIETDLNTIAVIRYPAGNIYIGSATSVRVGSLDVLFGKVFARVRGLFSVENENVVAGVEGTEFAFEVTGEGTVSVTVLDGNVLCSSKTLSWNPVRLGRGQTLSAGDATREPRVGPAARSEIEQLLSWVQRVDNTLASPSPPPPEPQPIPAPSPTAPSGPPAQWGYCCEAGKVFRTPLEGCRGGFYNTQGEAYQRCGRVTMGYCCASGQVFASAPEECRGSFSFDRASAYRNCASPPSESPRGFCCAGGEVTATARDRCRGTFYFDQASAQRRCASPSQPPSGYCCTNGQVTSAPRDQCRGNFFDDEPSARKSCAPQPQAGYCCAGGEVYPTNRAQCRGSFFTDQASARKACVALPERGYCCAGGKVSQTTREDCTGTFARLQEEAQRVCRRESEIRIEKGLVTKPPRDDAPR